MANSEAKPGEIFGRWVGGICGKALIVVLLCLASAVGALAYSVLNIGINTSITDMLSAELPFRQNDIAVREAFPNLDDSLLLIVEADQPAKAARAAEALSDALTADPALFPNVFYPETDPFFRQNGLLYLEIPALEDLSLRLAEAQPLLVTLYEDPSLRGLAGILKQALDPENIAGNEQAVQALAPALAAMAEAVETLPRDEEATTSWRALLQGDSSLGADSNRHLITVQPTLDYGSLAPAARALATIQAMEADLGIADDPTVSLKVTGKPLLLQDELASVEQGIGWVGLLSFVLVTLLLSIGLRSWPLVAATMVTLVVGLIWTAFAATVVVGELNLISVAFAVLFIGLSVDFGIHFSLRYQEAAGGDSDKTNALKKAANDIGGALALTAVTAAIGFLSFLPTSYRGLSELGLISAMGMGIALFSNLTLLPALLAILPPVQARPASRLRIGATIEGLVIRHRRAVLMGAGILALASLATLPFARFDDDPMNLRDPESPSVAALLAVLDDPRIQPYAAEVLTDDRAAGEALAAKLRELPQVASTIALSDYLPGDQEDKLAIIEETGFFLSPLLFPAPAEPAPDPAERAAALDSLRDSLTPELPGDLGLAAQALRQALSNARQAGHSPREIEGTLLGDLPEQLDSLAESLLAEEVSLETLPASLTSRSEAADGRNLIQVNPAQDLRTPEARQAFVEAIRTIAPDASGAPVIITAAGQAVVLAFGQAMAIAVIAITLLLLVILRSVRDSLLVLAPLCLAALMTVAATVLLNLPFNFANVIVLPLLFGLGVAGGIHMVLRARRGSDHGMMQSSTPRAVLFSAMTTIGSFCALALSSHRGTASMGELLTIAIALSLLSCLIVLPALLLRSAPEDS
ncbi:MAG: MMPL family transporter [Pseudomonadota bacterium]